MVNLIDAVQPNVIKTQLSDIYGFSEQLAQIPDLVSLTIGEPDFPTPEHVKKAGMAAIAADESHYTATWGRIGTRTAAANYLKQRYDVDYDPATQVVITNGVTEAMYATLATFVGKGDEVLLPTPAFPVYDSLVELNGGKLVEIDTQPDEFLLTPERLRATLQEHPHAKVLIVNFPSNPTGRSYSADQIQALAKVISQTNLVVVSDEIYSELTYTGRHVSLAKYLPDQTILFNGLSKSHAMTGWRIGVAAGPAPVMTEIAKVRELMSTSVMTAAQVAAEEAFGNGMDDAAPMRAEYERRRDYVYNEFTRLGFACEKPQGAFYLFAKIPERFHLNSAAFCQDVAKTVKVGMIPGSSFGAGGEGYVRISYATSMSNLEEAIRRLQVYSDEH
ncbi:aminotransferase class I/II-fold pyridoxal phosphate-dependent enzyme [Fructilactobacillus cliffordii]|uniref:aminotransferase class I/II-fold pyridoxal phosphate-dependent enzyme n=1 Tax=Fructilactobacillus cliffordii TaxID=2940299 RepID=UPI002093FA23|nr:aminotransferase class I/II-fold pyridoxal phosphate-dependent enzyme [Fructilactobacillus cliffordii]USS86250.1 aminotransferase class I/II-fold pyridoxal phosphate-dependent enzyme [Fructilactobacillus cliffordii]